MTDIERGRAQSTAKDQGTRSLLARATAACSGLAAVLALACGEGGGLPPTSAADPDLGDPVDAKPGLTLVPLLEGCTQSVVADMSVMGKYVVGTCYSDAGRTTGQAFYWKRGADSAVGLGHLSTGATLSSAAGVTADGLTIVGVDVDATGASTAFTYSVAKGSMTALITTLPTWYTQSAATGITPDGKTVIGCIAIATSTPCTEMPVAGTQAPSGTPPSSAFLLTDGTLTLPTPAWDFDTSYTNEDWLTSAWAVSKDGSSVAGDRFLANDFGDHVSSYRWTQAGGSVDLGTAIFAESGENHLYSTPRAMSADGALVAGSTVGGIAETAFYLQVPYFWTAATGFVLMEQSYLSDLGVYAVTPKGDVMGGGWFSNSLDPAWNAATLGAAFLWDDVNGMMQLDSLFAYGKGDLVSDYGAGAFIPINVTALSEDAVVIAGNALIPSAATPAPLQAYVGITALPPR